MNKFDESESEIKDRNVKFQNNILVLIEQNEGKFQIIVKNVTSIDYLYDIQIYLDCILRITQEEFTYSSLISYDDLSSFTSSSCWRASVGKIRCSTA